MPPKKTPAPPVEGGPAKKANTTVDEVFGQFFGMNNNANPFAFVPPPMRFAQSAEAREEEIKRLHAQINQLKVQLAAKDPAIPPILSILKLPAPWTFDTFEIITNSTLHTETINGIITDGSALLNIINSRMKPESRVVSIIAKDDSGHKLQIW